MWGIHEIHSRRWRVEVPSRSRRVYDQPLAVSSLALLSTVGVGIVGWGRTSISSVFAFYIVSTTPSLYWLGNTLLQGKHWFSIYLQSFSHVLRYYKTFFTNDVFGADARFSSYRGLKFTMLYKNFRIYLGKIIIYILIDNLFFSLVRMGPLKLIAHRWCVPILAVCVSTGTRAGMVGVRYRAVSRFKFGGLIRKHIAVLCLFKLIKRFVSPFLNI